MTKYNIFRKGIVFGIVIFFVGISITSDIKSSFITLKNPSSVIQLKEERYDYIKSDFESGMDGWTAFGDGYTQWKNTGGNPGGFGYYLDEGQGIALWAEAPSKFLGDWTIYDYVQTDVKCFVADITQQFEFWISGPGGSALYHSNIYPDLNWKTITAPIQQSYWSLESGTWEDLISDVRHFRVDVEFGTWYDLTGIDNVIITSGGYPNLPNIDGSNSGKPGIEYDYVFNSIDPDGDDVKYIINWGDTTSNTTGFNTSGADVTVSHTWVTIGIYIITVKAEDESGLVSPEATKDITIPRNKAIDNPILILFEAYPLLLKILKMFFKQLQI